MYAFRLLPTSLSLLASGLVAALAGTAHAGQSCAQDSDCGHGFACKVVAESGCAAVACAPGQVCPTLPPCEVTQIKECEPGPCNAHSDCADGMVCIESAAITTCPTAPAGAACPPNTDCAAPPPPQPSDCTTVTTRTCTPRYELPCANEGSCGTGFNCVPDPDSCSCGASGGIGASTPSSSGTSGSGTAPSSGTGTAGAGNAPSSGFAPPPSSGVGGSPSSGPTPPSGATPVPDPSPPPDCTCTPSTTKHCEPKAVSCNADSDCPATWTCVVVGGTSSGCAGAARILPDGGVEVLPPVCDPAPPTTTIKQCQPPYYSGGPKGGIGIGIPETGGGTTGVNTGTPQDPIPGSNPVDPRAPSGQPPTTGETGNDVGNHSTDSNGAMAEDSGSCQMALGHASTTGASLLGLLGIAGMARRRRTRWG